jgi:hypothetical protein
MLNMTNFECKRLKPDRISLEIEIGPSVVLLYGTFLRLLWFIKVTLLFVVKLKLILLLFYLFLSFFLNYYLKGKLFQLGSTLC